MVRGEDTVDRIKSACNIVDVVGQVVSLKRTGANYKGLCPFHNEKTPSFVVSDSKQIFTCFGCGAKGDVIEFTKRYYGLDFLEAVQKLAKDYGINLPERSYSRQQTKSELYEINRMAARFFYDSFTSKENPAYTYMSKRGLKAASLKKFGIGYADGEWDSLIKHFEKKGVAVNKLYEAGLVSKSDNKSENKYFDKFRNRVMFPIINTGGNVVGFGGRILGKGDPKYLNSQETPVFSKKNNIYGLNLTRTEASRKGYLILVEGYMDVISLYQQGIENVGASLGTALTENQAKLIRRFVDQVIMAYDSDTAGILATIRGLEILYKEKIKARVVNMPEGMDPDDFVNKKGKEEFLDLIEKGAPYGEYMINVLKQQHDLTKLEGRLDFLKGATDFLSKLRPLDADGYIRKLAKDTGISEGAIRKEINDRKEESSRTIPIISRQEEIEDMDRGSISNLEKNFLSLLMAREDYLPEIRKYKDLFTSYKGKALFEKIEEVIDLESALDIKKLTDSLDRNLADSLHEIQENVKLAGKEEQILQECINSYNKEKLNIREKEILDILDLSTELTGDNKDQIINLEELENELIEIQNMKNRQGEKR